MRSLLASLSRIGVHSSDDELTANKKRFVVLEAVLMSCGGILWGGICLFLDKTGPSIIPFGYVVLSAINIFLFKQYRWFAFTQGFQTGISLLLPFMFQWYLGGVLCFWRGNDLVSAFTGSITQLFQFSGELDMALHIRCINFHYGAS